MRLISWTSYYATTTKYVVSDLKILQEHTLTTSQERLTAKEAMAHPYFAPVRQAEQAELQNSTNAHQ